MTLDRITPDLSIDVVSDVVCPWCYIGKRRLEKALRAVPEVRAHIAWRPFQLDPTIPAAGLDRRAYLEKKLGGTARVAEIHERIEALGRDEGIAFAFERMRRAPNTFDAHRLLYWAAAGQRQGEMAEILFRRNFEEGQDLGDTSVLAEAAEEAGLDGPTVAARLRSDVDRKQVRAEIEAFQRAGITGVPFFIFNGRFAVSGAQAVDVLVAAIRKAAADDAPVVAA